MAVESHDIVRIPILDEWVVQGLKYGQLSWTQTFNRMGKASPYKKIQNIALGKIAESAVFEYLNKSNIKFDLKGSTKWYEVDIDDLEIRNHQIDVKSNFVDKNSDYIKRKKIKSDAEAKLEWYLKCHALVPADQVASKNRGNSKMKKRFVFVFAEGTINSNSSKHIIHAFWDYRWLKKAEHKNYPHLGNLRISSLSSKTIELTIYGTTGINTAVIEKIKLQNGETLTKNSYHQVFAAYVSTGLPDNDLIIKSEDGLLTEVIKSKFSFTVDSNEKPIKVISNDWNSVDIQIDHCYIAGWIDKEEFLIISKEYPRYTKIFEQYQDTLTSNFACEVKDLEPISKIGDF